MSAGLLLAAVLASAGQVPVPPPAARQSERLAYAEQMLAAGRHAEAFGALSVMLATEPRLAGNRAVALGQGRALIGLGRYRAAAETLAVPQFARDPEGCAWRMLALAAAGEGRAAYGQWNCALPAIRATRGAERRSFILAGSAAAVSAGRADRALQWLGGLPTSDAEAQLLRGLAARRAGKLARARPLFVAAQRSADPRVSLSAQLALAELDAAGGRPNWTAIAQTAERVRYRWRGDALERRAIRLAFRSNAALGRDRPALAAAASLMRYHPPGPDSAAMLKHAQRRLAAALAPDARVKLPDAAGLFWEFRDLAPSGAEGDALVTAFAGRLQQAGLYRRAADLIAHLLASRAQGVTAGPLALRAATLYLLAGQPRRAAGVLAQTHAVALPAAMVVERRRLEALALANDGRVPEALAVLDSVPGGGAIIEEIFWRQRQWQALAELPLPASGPLDHASEARLLRRAVALALLGDEAGLARLRQAHGAAFARRPGGPAFSALTGAGAVDGAALERALGAVSGASPAGAYADLLVLPASSADTASGSAERAG